MNTYLYSSYLVLIMGRRALLYSFIAFEHVYDAMAIVPVFRDDKAKACKREAPNSKQ